MTAVDPIPGDRPYIVSYLTIKGAAEAIEFYKKAFDAVEHSRMPHPDGRLVHAELSIGGSLVYLSDDFPEMTGQESSPAALGSTTVTMHRYVEDCDAAIAQALAAGAEVIMPATDMFWGDRFGVVQDPFGHQWSIATHVRDVSPEEMASGLAT